MKVLVLVLSLFFFESVLSSEVSWPTEHYTIETINNQFFGRLKNYMDIIKSNNPIMYTQNGFRVFYKKYNFVKIRASFKIRNGITYLNYKSRNKNLIVRVTNDSEKIARKLLLFNFEDIISKEEFSIEINKFDFKFQKIKYQKNHFYMNYSMDWGELHLSERKQTNILRSKLWVSCEECSGEPLVLIVQNDNNFIMKKHFIGPLQVAVSPRVFYELANTWYLPGIIGQTDSIIGNLQALYGWPNEI